MKEKLLDLWTKIQENKDVVIKIGGVVVGAVLGAVIASAIANAQEEFELEQSLIDDIEGEDEDSEVEED